MSRGVDRLRRDAGVRAVELPSADAEAAKSSHCHVRFRKS